MTVSRVWALGLVLVGLGAGVPGAAALNVPHTLHHAKIAERHLVQPHRALHSGTRAARSSVRSAAHAKAESRLVSRGPARRASLTHRRHRFYERFTASSFANGSIFEGD